MTPLTMSAPRGPAAADRGGAAASLPGRDELIDAAGAARAHHDRHRRLPPAYGGHGYLAAGAAGVAARPAAQPRRPAGAAAAARRGRGRASWRSCSSAASSARPAPSACRCSASVAGAAVSGWQQLLTTARPVGRTAGLLVLPYLLGLFSGVAGHALARRTALAAAARGARPPSWSRCPSCSARPQPAAAVLAGRRVRRRHARLGRGAPAARHPGARHHRQAAPLAADRRRRPPCSRWPAPAPRSSGRTCRARDAHSASCSTSSRRSTSTAYPSPLAGFRDYTKDVPASLSVYGKELLATTGLAAGSLVRIAAMDTYDGLAWGVANSAASTGAGSSFGGFQRVGALLPGAVAGPARTATITVQPAYAAALAARPGRAPPAFAFTGHGRSRAARRRSASTSPPPPGSFRRRAVRAALHRQRGGRGRTRPVRGWPPRARAARLPVYL